MTKTKQNKLIKWLDGYIDRAEKLRIFGEEYAIVPDKIITVYFPFAGDNGTRNTDITFWDLVEAVNADVDVKPLSSEYMSKYRLAFRYRDYLVTCYSNKTTKDKED